MLAAQKFPIKCLMWGHAPKNSFNVDIAPTECVTTLKERILQKKECWLTGIDPDSLDLFKTSWPIDNTSEVKSVLPPFDQVMDVIGDVSPTNILILVKHESLMTQDLQLNCLISGEDPRKHIFVVTITNTAKVDNLRDEIKTKRLNTFRDLDAAHLDLFKICQPIGKNPDVEQVHPINPWDQLFNLFCNVDPTELHIFVNRNNVCDSPMAEGKDDKLIALTEAFLRATTITSKNLTPSQSAKSREYAKIQRSPLRILDSRYAAEHPINTVGPPIQLFNPAFAYFASKAFDPQYEVPMSYLRRIRKLMCEFAKIHPKEDSRRLHLRPFLEGVLSHPFTSVNNSDKTTPDFVAQGSSLDFSFCLIISEEKNEFGDGGSDPSVQVGFSYQRLCSQVEHHDLRLKCCCPTFLVAHAGSWFAVMGGIITTSFIVQRLTDFLWVPLHNTHDDSQLYRIARVFHALKESIQRLQEWYHSAVKLEPFDTASPTYHPRFFPTPDQYVYKGTLVKFQFQEPLEKDESCVTYRATTKEETPKDIVVKFVTSYGVGAHQEMESAGFAPPLLYYGPINLTDDPSIPSYGSLHMVVMDYVVGRTLDQVKPEDIPIGFYAELQEAISQLHNSGYVFGDLRPPNVIITPNTKPTFQLIDFDWAGKEDEVTYPANISSSIHWPNGVEEFELIRKEHDIAMINSLLSHL